MSRSCQEVAAPRRPISLAWALLVAGLPLGGCGGRTSADYVPPSDDARQAVVAVLDAWQRGEPIGPIGEEPTVQIGDTHRKPGQTLASYEILGELPTGDGRRFAVRLTLANPEATEKVNYLVIGIDPLWVFREEDYKMATHWEHNMPADAPSDETQSLP